MRSLMPTRYMSSAAVALLLGTQAACYHQVVDTGRPVSAQAQVIDKPWQMSFIYGLVPPPVEQTASACPSGVARVETQHTFLNGLVAGLTFGIVTPMRVTVTCAGGAAAHGGAPVSTIRAGDSREEQDAAFDAAIESASASRGPAFLQF